MSEAELFGCETYYERCLRLEAALDQAEHAIVLSHHGAKALELLSKNNAVLNFDKQRSRWAIASFCLRAWAGWARAQRAQRSEMGEARRLEAEQAALQQQLRRAHEAREKHVAALAKAHDDIMSVVERQRRIVHSLRERADKKPPPATRADAEDLAHTKEQLAVLDTYDEIFESIANSAKTQAGGSPTSRSGAL